MLVLTRKQDQELLIGGNIRVRVLSIEGGRVRLGISAPLDVPVLRSELSEKMQAAPLVRKSWMTSEVEDEYLAIA